MKRRQCTATKKDGRRCGMAALQGTELCYNHSPRTAKKRRRSRSKGGKRNRVAKALAVADVGSVKALQEHLGEALADVKAHPNSLQRAQTIKGLVQAASQLVQAFETRELLEQLKDELQQQRRRES